MSIFYYTYVNRYCSGMSALQKISFGMQSFSLQCRVLITRKGNRFTVNYVTKLERTRTPRRDLADRTFAW